MKKIITIISFFLVLFPCFVMAQDGNNTPLFFIQFSSTGEIESRLINRSIKLTWEYPD